MSRIQNDIDLLKKRIAQNERHLDEMNWALLSDGEADKGRDIADVAEVALKAENEAFNARIDKLILEA